MILVILDVFSDISVVSCVIVNVFVSSGVLLWRLLVMCVGEELFVVCVCCCVVLCV